MSTEIKITLDDQSKQALAARMAKTGRTLPDEAIARTLLFQFARFAPDALVASIADQAVQSGSQGDAWEGFILRIREEQRRELSLDLGLAEAVRKVATARPNN